MKKLLPKTSACNKIILACIIMLVAAQSWAQSLLPFTIQNTSPYVDTDLYVAIVGEDFSVPSKHVWIDCKTSTAFPMAASYNTIQGPIYNGNGGPGLNGKYASCFSKLSDIPNKTVMLPPIQGCRMFISTKQQLYFYFFGASGAPSGYTSPSNTDPTDPNTGIKYEVIELTYNQYGFWGNTTRVDNYQYPMGLELDGKDGSVQKTGELKNHTDIGTAFKASVPTEFQGCLDPVSGAIHFPTKTAAFADGSIGTMPTPGPYVNYMKPYIDAVWSKYASEDLIFDSGQAGIWKGRVQNEQLIMVCQSGGFSGRKGIVDRRPTTQEAFEGKGVLDKVIQDGTTDLVVQAQICAALTRHVIDVTTPNVGVQTWSDPSKYYQAAPCNYYAKFWHTMGISLNQVSYGFAYDDVFSQSSTLYNSSPSKVIVTFGGFVGTVVNNVPPAINITSPTSSATFTVPATINIQTIATDVDGTVSLVEFFNGTSKLGQATTYPFSFTWSNVSAGTYTLTAKATDNKGAVTTSSPVTISVTNPVVESPYGGTRWSIPGTLEVENFDIGGQGLAYNDVTSSNDGGAYRSEGVDIEAIPTGGYNVGYIQSGEWMKYMVNIATTNTYKIEAYVAAMANGKTFTIDIDGKLIGTFNVPNTGGWQTWQKVVIDNVPLTAGQKTLRINATSSEFNIDKIVFSNLVIEGPFTGNRINIPGSVQAENFDLGGQGIAYNDVTAANEGGAFRAEGVDIESMSTGGYNVGFIQAGEWMKYMVSVNGSGVFKLEARVAAMAAGKTFTVDFDGTTMATVSVPNTGGWQTWQTVTVGYYRLTAGQKIMRILANSSEFNIDYLVFTASSINQSPTVSITSPVNNTILTAPAKITITAAANDPDGSISKVDFYNGTTFLATDYTAPYSYSMANLAAGTYNLIAKATDNSSAITTSASVAVKVLSATPVNIPPSVSITDPAANSSVNAPATVTINATATDSDGSIAKVEFYNGSTLLGTDVLAPYSFTWSNISAGTYTITAKATDNSSASTTSTGITFTVKSYVVNTCTNVPTYVENGGYIAGSQVTNAGNKYECKPWPYTGWCNSSAWAYAPGTGSNWTDAWILISSCTASAKTMALSSNQALLAPNPATDIVTVNLSQDSKVTIYNNLGNMVMNQIQVDGNGSIMISELPSGIYNLKIETETDSFNTTLVKQ